MPVCDPQENREQKIPVRLFSRFSDGHTRQTTRKAGRKVDNYSPDKSPYRVDIPVSVLLTLIYWIVIYPLDRVINLSDIPDLGPVSRNKPRKVFGPVNPFLVHLYLKTEKWIRLHFLYEGNLCSY